MNRILLGTAVVLFLGASGLIALICWPNRGPAVRDAAATASPISVLPVSIEPTQSAARAQADAIALQEADQDRTTWRQEVLAQEYEQTFVTMWDAMRARVDDQYRLLEAQPFDRISIRSFGDEVRHAWDVRVAASSGDARVLDHGQWVDLVEGVVRHGERIEHCEWHHAAFEIGPDGSARSQISMKLFLRNDGAHSRSVVSGMLGILWSRNRDPKGLHLIQEIDATHLTLATRSGDPAFTEVFSFSPDKIGADEHCTMDPVLVLDLDGKGRSDIALPSLNLALINTSTPGSVSFTGRPLFRRPISVDSMHSGPFITAAVAGDFMGHGRPDLLVCGQDLPPNLYVSNPERQFADDPIPIAHLPASTFQLPMSITAGDVDGQGRLDVWIGQYRRPYEGGNLPSPYYDANDGYPSFLLLNQGSGEFVDATVPSGLAAKRFRRNYASALLDLNGDGKLDLITINDFSGIDLFTGDGAGHFSDATASMIDQRSSFGMSLAIGDFLGRGLLDLFVGGMGSTTARRLEQMNLGRAEYPMHQQMRMKMAYGNRLLLANPGSGFKQATFNDKVARTGWSWGCAGIDVANAGNLSLYIANGNMSRSTAKDYCTRYWTQDIFMPSTTPPEVLQQLFSDHNADFAGWSWNPFEHKALLMNEGGGNFLDVAYLMDLGFEYDAREVVAEDFDGDGRTDLLVMELRQSTEAHEPTRPVLHLYRNQLQNPNHWLLVRLPESAKHLAMGATIDISYGGQHRRGVVVSGDAYRTQRPPCQHFGLGTCAAVDSVHVRWPDGTERTISHPAVDGELVVSPDEAR